METLISEAVGGFFVIVVAVCIIGGLIRLIFGPIDLTKHNNYNDDHRSKYI